MLMKIKNTGNRRIRLDSNVFLDPNQVMEVKTDVGRWAIRKNAGVVDVTPKRPRKKTYEPKKTVEKPEVINTANLEIKVKKDDSE